MIQSSTLSFSAVFESYVLLLKIFADFVVLMVQVKFPVHIHSIQQMHADALHAGVGGLSGFEYS